MEIIPDKDLVTMLKSPHEHEVDEAFRALYRQYYHFVGSYLKEFKAKPQDVRDAFQESLIALYSRLQQGEEITIVGGWLRSTARNSLVRTQGKHQWLVNEDMSSPAMASMTSGEALIDEAYISKEQTAILKDLLNNLGDICKGLLIGYYYNQASITQLMDDYNINSQQVTRNQKYMCLKKLKNTILSNPSLINYFKS